MTEPPNQLGLPEEAIRRGALLFSYRGYFLIYAALCRQANFFVAKQIADATGLRTTNVTRRLEVLAEHGLLQADPVTERPKLWRLGTSDFAEGFWGGMRDLVDELSTTKPPSPSP